MQNQTQDNLAATSIVSKNLPEISLKQGKLLNSLRPNSLKKRSSYDAEIPRRTIEAICGVSTNTLRELENSNVITPNRVKHGGVEIVTYGIKDVQAIFKHKKVSFKKKKEAEVIAIFSQKGGVGKSAFTQHIASMLSLVGKVLVVDLDAQSDATVLLGVESKLDDLVKEDAVLDPTIAELMDWTLSDDFDAGYRKAEFKDAIKSASPTLDVIPADLDLGEINYSLNRLPLKARTMSDGSEEPAVLHMVKEVFDKVKDQYDYILVDCPPNIETCNVSALFASNRIIVPLELEAKSLTIMRRNVLFLEKLKALHPGFKWDKVLVVPNKFRRENIKIKALAALEDRYRHSDFVSLSEVIIPNSSIIDKCSDSKEPIFAATTRYGNKTSQNSINQAKEFTNYFWALIHECMELPLERLIFDQAEIGAE